MSVTVLRKVLHELVQGEEDAVQLCERIMSGALAPFSEVRIFVRIPGPDLAEKEEAREGLARALSLGELVSGLYWAHGVTCRVLSTRRAEETEAPFSWFGHEPKKIEIVAP